MKRKYHTVLNILKFNKCERVEEITGQTPKERYWTTNKFTLA
jgi:hypothetical protein